MDCFIDATTNYQIRNCSSAASIKNNLTSAGLRPIVIDGSNVAMHHGLSKVFSCKGIQLVIDYFRGRGHMKIVTFVPQWRRASSASGNTIRDIAILEQLYKEALLVFTPSRRVDKVYISSYDDRFILKYASEEGAVVVSNDHFKDLYCEPVFKETIEKRILPFTFVGDKVMFPDDPLGRSGPTLDDFLTFS
ncbi:hypothetical protein HELRODRAFT_63824 [Helobdella robusta]|uniref:RNase NYN domain-containing protein n=1 Tax=Helobdella robusta TaxID=6412 RepID=T1FXK9_HELRO|nr:hypothetical protein HELRODRAFT_63824 [Helobdella robusta]ESO12221.1 hypothetical protein HELRODRAFT_63824 [Helobdella robusta]